MLMVLGASHHDLELADLDRLCAGTETLTRHLHALAGRDGSPMAGAVVLATCNRLEIYADARLFHESIEELSAAVGSAAGLSPGEAAGMLQARVGAPVAAHLFKVAAGLDSMVVGESEISGQVVSALRSAQQAHAATPTLNLLFQMAIRTAKQVATRAPLGPLGRSIASVALDLASPGGPARRALLVGTGAFARVVSAALRQRGCADLAVYSPSGRAESFAERHHARAVVAGELAGALRDVDLVVCCSGRGASALASAVADAVAERDTVLPIVDLALRPDVPQEVRAMDGVRLVDLASVSAATEPAHQQALTAAGDIVAAAVNEFELEMVARRLDPVVVALREHVRAAVDAELDRFRASHEPDLVAEVELAMHRVIQSLLHVPTLRARELARRGESAGYVDAVHTLFGIDVQVRDVGAAAAEKGALASAVRSPASEAPETPRVGGLAPGVAEARDAGALAAGVAEAWAVDLADQAASGAREPNPLRRRSR